MSESHEVHTMKIHVKAGKVHSVIIIRLLSLYLPPSPVSGEKENMPPSYYCKLTDGYGLLPLLCFADLNITNKKLIIGNILYS